MVVSYWVPDIPPRFTSKGGGPISDGHFQLLCKAGEVHDVTMSQAEGYCESTFSFKYTLGEGVMQDWTAAKPKEGCPPDVRRIEYRLIHQPEVESVKIEIRDATSKEPMQRGHFNRRITYSVPNAPRVTRLGSGQVRRGRCGFLTVLGERHWVQIGGEGYCESTFEFQVARGMGEEAVIRDWTVAEAKDPDCPGRRIEYRLTRNPNEARWRRQND